MRKTIRNLFLAGLLFFVLAFASFSVGVKYDEKNKLYPETNWVSYDLAIGIIYGKRWERIGNALFLFGALLNIVAGVIWYRKEETQEYKMLLNENE